MTPAPLLLAALVAAQPAAGSAPGPATCAPEAWPHWRRYVEVFISGDGRVLDRTTGDRTTSESQAYALFFALVANDRPVFERVLRWTADNLAQTDLARHLPAWNWGRRADGSWGVLDSNSASDADLWMAYALLEAERLWGEPRHGVLARSILAQVAEHEVAAVGALGPALLPAPRGFALDGGRAWRLNPSYLPPQLLRRLHSAGIPGAWAAVLRSSVRIVRDPAPRGVVADWVVYRSKRGFDADPEHGPTGSYDAIRNYLWVGMLPEGDPLRPELAPATDGMLQLLARDGRLPEQVDAQSLRTRGEAPVGFYGALLPLAESAGDGAARRMLEERLAAAARGGLYGSPPTYYDQNLILFGRGFVEGRYRFAPDGRLVTTWEARCDARAR
ncbi:MAG TPA: cellulose synthase complex periplasmic endoglucanase BcsZ [Anaeromyxobacteraceae bacterium]|nr:cellulose synthase complex periplasmic endoglucanase BcsZ [Anaeromyxobacteraceae bacterium]